MGRLVVNDKGIVVPGEIVAQGMDYLPASGTYRRGDNILSSKLGIVSIEGRAIKLIPLSGRYVPKKYDVIICNVIDVTMSGWRVETNSAYSALLSVKDATTRYIPRGADLTQYYNLGDYLVAKVVNVTSQKLVDLSTKGPGLRKLTGGRIFYVNCHKVPRIIGKNASMVTLIKEATGCQIIVGQNGVIWMNGRPEMEIIVEKTIKLIEEQSHTHGLTENVKAFLGSETKDVPRDEGDKPAEE